MKECNILRGLKIQSDLSIFQHTFRGSEPGTYRNSDTRYSDTRYP